MSVNSPPECEIVPESSEYGQVFLRHIAYELVESKTLTLGLNSDIKGNFQLEFDSPHAVRVIDEGQICEFWNEHSLKAGWLWQVKSGGFLDLESTRNTFWLKDIHKDSLLEYLVIADQCVFVLTNFPPVYSQSISLRKT